MGLKLKKMVEDFLEQAKIHFSGGSNERSKAAGVEPSQPWPRASTEGASVRRVNEARDAKRPRLYAETRLILARKGKGGYFKIVTDAGEKLVFEIWISKKYQDQHGNPIRKIFPRVYYCGDRVIRFPRCKEGEQSPSLPIGMLYGKSFDAERFPPEHREDLEVFAGAMERGIKEERGCYVAECKERKANRHASA